MNSNLRTRNAALTFLCVLLAPAGYAQSLPDLLQKNGCSGCHAINRAIVGPALQEVGKRYADDKAATAKLEAKVRGGGSGVWGKSPMPPQRISDAELKLVVKEILKLR